MNKEINRKKYVNNYRFNLICSLEFLFRDGRQSSLGKDRNYIADK